MSRNRIFLDLTSSAAELEIPNSVSSAVICAGVTNQEACRHDPVGTRAINVTATLALVRQLSKHGCSIVFLSTNLVFDGSRPLRRAEDDLCPMTTYGGQKAEVESALHDLGRQCAVIRLTKVFHRGLPILQKWRDALRSGQTITSFDDYRCSPIAIELVTRCIAEIATRGLSGIWQVSALDDLSYALVATNLAKQMGVNPSLVKVTATPPGSVEHLPRFTTLDSSRLSTELGITVPPAMDTVETALAQ